MAWVAGTSGNPTGRPPDKYSIRSILKSIGNQLVDTPGGKKRKAEVMWTAIYDEAINGNTKAAFLIADRLEGRVPLQQNISISNGTVEDSLNKIAKSIMAVDVGMSTTTDNADQSFQELSGTAATEQQQE